MKAAQFDYVRPASVTEAVQALVAADGDGKVIAGGQSLVPVLAMRLARPSVLVDINRIPGLAAASRVGEDRIRLGALVRHCDLVRQRHSPLLAEAASWIGHTAIRSRGTSGGSLAHADPAAELPVVATALDAQITAIGPHGSRTVGAEELFMGTFETSLDESELITAIEMPIPQVWGFAEFSRRHGDFGLVTVVAAQVAGEWRIAVGGIASVPFRAREAESVMAGGALTSERIAEAARAAAAAVQPGSDIHASAGYRTAMTQEYTRRALASATARVGASV